MHPKEKSKGDKESKKNETEIDFIHMICRRLGRF